MSRFSSPFSQIMAQPPAAGGVPSPFPGRRQRALARPVPSAIQNVESLLGGMTQGGPRSVATPSPEDAFTRWMNWMDNFEEVNPKAVRQRLVEAGLPAKTARQVTGKATMKRAYNSILKELADAGVDQRIIKDLRKVKPEQIARLRPKIVTAALAERQKDPILHRVIRGVARKLGAGEEFMAPPPHLPEELATAARGVPGGQAARAGRQLGRAGVKGFGLASRAGRVVGGPIGMGFLGLDLLYGAGQLSDIAGGKGERAREMAMRGLVQGPQGVQPIVANHYLTNLIAQQESLAARRSVAMGVEPQLSAEILNALAQTGGAPALTSTEVGLGAAKGLNREQSHDRRRAIEKFDRMLEELG